jgi:hypothetical protein
VTRRPVISFYVNLIGAVQIPVELFSRKLGFSGSVSRFMSSVENKIKNPPSAFEKVGGSVSRFKIENKSRTEPPKYPLKRSGMTQLEARRISYLVVSLGTTGWRFESSLVHQLFYFQYIKPPPTSVW